jgi:hypothetical protein
MKKARMILCFCFSGLVVAGQNSNPPCSTPEARQFDFWVGEWNAFWKDSLRGSNRIEKMFGNCTIQENFIDPKTNYLGKSWSVYNSNYKIWQQTWVDNNGGYIHLTGGMVSDSMILKTMEQNVPSNVSPTGKILSRMVYYNIKPNSFDWSWEASTDGGLNWTPRWQIHYERKK